MQVANTRIRDNFIRDFLSIAAHVSGGETVVDFRDGMKGLMDVTNVVDNETESEGSLVSVVREVFSDFAHVVRAFDVCLVSQESSQVSQS